jgi:hypothetical protein
VEGIVQVGVTKADLARFLAVMATWQYVGVPSPRQLSELLLQRRCVSLGIGVNTGGGADVTGMLTNYVELDRITVEKTQVAQAVRGLLDRYRRR